MMQLISITEEKLCSSAVIQIRFLFEDMYLISVGGSDATLFRWKIQS